MNKTLFILVFCITFNFVFSQTTEKIAEIRKCVKIINSENNYQLKKLDNDYFTDVKNAATDNGQELVAYYKEGNLKKIVYSLGLSNCMQTNEYYFDKDNLIFVYEQTHAYITPNELTAKPVFEGRYYFDEMQLFQTKLKGERICSSENTLTKVQALENVKNFLADLKNAK